MLCLLTDIFDPLTQLFQLPIIPYENWSNELKYKGNKNEDRKYLLIILYISPEVLHILQQLVLKYQQEKYRLMLRSS